MPQKKINKITQNSAAYLRFLKINKKKIRNLQNSTVFYCFSNIYSSLQCTVHHCGVCVLETVADSVEVATFELPTSRLHKSRCHPTLLLMVLNIWLKSVTQKLSKVMRARRLSLKLVQFLQELEVKHTGPDQANFYG